MENHDKSNNMLSGIEIIIYIHCPATGHKLD